MKPICIEVLYPEYNNLYGDRGNIQYLCKKLEACGREVEITETHLGDTPAFTQRHVDILYIGPSTEEQQERQLLELLKVKEALQERMEEETLTLITGNAVELLGQYIEKEDGSRVEALGFIGTYAKRFSRLRFNDLCVGEHAGLQVVGFKNQLSHSYCVGEATHAPFLTMKRGSGYHPESRLEGVANGGFVATYLLGPLLPLNPPLTEFLLQKLLGEDISVPALPFEQEAYEKRLLELTK